MKQKKGKLKKQGNNKDGNKQLSRDKRRKVFLTLGLLVCASVVLYAGNTPKTQADIETKVTEWQTAVTSILNILVGIYGVVGGFLVFVQYMQGNEQAQKNLIRFIIGLAVFGIAATVASFLSTP
ncbi:DUF4134 domain-containing protein [Aggregatimonas sangjinii]|uniref:DUF4134 domain-containing protein n=1 Tax=Aggregatimonas sangjinii TaxID=2583587 RepID=A0A5B7STJ4_9FLAO|nr:DUF4134 family protein [Aggregatimonas sangjinii]QCX00659.1 DUF4134 domain-containing protein [Aggregatimonas sangjinii]